MSSGAEQQDDLERMLAASRELRARYRASSSEEPSAALDDAIRAQARRAVGSRPRRAGAPFGGTWRVPLSIAAVMVLSVSLTVMTVMQDKHLPSADQLPERKGVPAAEPQAAPPPRAAVSAPPAPAATARAEAKQKVPALKDQPSESATPSTGGAAHDEERYVTAPAELDERAAQAHKKEAEPFPAAPVVPAPAPQSTPAPPNAPPQTSAVQGSRAQPEQERDLARSTDALTKRSRASEQADNAPKAASANALEAQGKLREDNAQARDERIAPAKPQAAPMPPGAAERPQTAIAAAPWENDPKAWLRHIELLVRQQHMSEARESFKAFRQRYPSYPLPSEFPLREP